MQAFSTKGLTIYKILEFIFKAVTLNKAYQRLFSMNIYFESELPVL
jgi:hypothetical protein